MRVRFLLASASAAIIVMGAVAGVAQADFTISEGQAFTGKVVDIGNCALTSATIYWGDGTATSPGASDGGTGIKGTHIYTEERTSPAAGNVSYTCSNVNQQPPPIDFQATVRDAPLTAAGRDVAGTSGQSLTGVVAHFSDTNPGALAGDFSALITWGDGLSSYGSVAAAPGGGFDVSGTHTYGTTGSFAVSTSITDVGGSTAGASSAAQIAAPAPPPPPPVGPPIARLTVTPNPTCTGLLTKLDGSASSAPAGIVRYRFEYNTADPNPFNLGYQLVSSGTNSAPVTQFDWNEYPPAPGIGGLLGGVEGFRDPAVVTLTVTDARGATATATTRVTFAQSASFQSREHCPRFSLIYGFPFAPGKHTFPHLTPSSGGVTTILPCRSTTLCIGSLSVLSTQNLRAAAARRRKPQLIARVLFFIKPGKSKRVQTRLTKTGRRLLRAHKQIPASVVISALTPTGKLVKRSKTITLKPHR